MPHISWTGHWRGRSPDGLSHQRARDVVYPTGGIVRGKFPSRKTGRMVHHEGLLELDALYLFETSPLIVSYAEQPETSYYPDGARTRRYTPDFELVLANDVRVLIEVKPKRNADSPDVKHTLSRVAAFYAQSGRAFQILTDEVIRIEPRLSTLRWIYRQAPRLHSPYLKGVLALRSLAHRFPMSFRAAQESLASFGVDPYSLLIAGALICDLSRPATLDTSLNLNLENRHEWFRISNQLDF